jgi:hypothetical protein
MIDSRYSIIHSVVESNSNFDKRINCSDLVWHVGDGLLN